MKFVKLTLFTVVWMMVLFFSTSHSTYAAATGMSLINRKKDGLVMKRIRPRLPI